VSRVRLGEGDGADRLTRHILTRRADLDAVDAAVRAGLRACPSRRDNSAEVVDKRIVDVQLSVERGMKIG
jgi:hypothetical protein